MKVIVTRRNFYGMECWEIMPEVFFINENETPEDALRELPVQVDFDIDCVDGYYDDEEDEDDD